jgi:hypothetical protein
MSTVHGTRNGANFSPEHHARESFELFCDGGVVEVRAFDGYNTYSGYFDNPGAFAKAALKQDEARHTAYVTLNPVEPALLAKANNRIKKLDRRASATPDKHVLRRRWILVDCDPVRPADIPSTKEEKAAALAKAREVKAGLESRGIATIVAADSGNGYHLLIRVDLPNDEASTKLVEDVLQALDLLFSDERVKIDTSVYNASRITKLYGTTPRKGDGTTDRPHRPSRLLSIPEDLRPVDRELLEELAAEAPEIATDEEPKTAGGGRIRPNIGEPFDIPGFLSKHGITVLRQGTWSGTGMWANSQKWLVPCPWNGHTDYSCHIIQAPNGAISCKCKHDSCSGYRWQDFRELYEPGVYDRRDSANSAQEDRSLKPEPLPWPELAEEALYGLAGDIVRAVEPHNEADPVALLGNMLCAFGNVAGRGAFARVGADEHHTKLFIVLVGETAKGRKGVSWGPVRGLIRAVDPGWADNRVVSGLSSGEGLIYAVRDEVRGMRKDEEVVLDPGEPDKRLLVLEGELANVLKVMGRDGNTLSPIIRQAWDGDRLRTLTKNNPTKSTGAHVSLIGHVTKAELLRHLNATEVANGFANRILWLMVRRSKELPFGGKWDVTEMAELVQRLDSAVRFARQPRVIRWGESAKDVWREVYGPLSEGKPGLFGAIVGRAEAQTGDSLRRHA